MFANIVYRRFLKVVGIFVLVSFFAFAAGKSASAQLIVSSSYDPTTGNLTATDTNGNTYVLNLSTLSLASRTDVPGSFTPRGGTSLPTEFVINPIGNGQFTINAIPSSQKLLSCSASSATTTITVTEFPPPSFLPTPTQVTVPIYPATCYLTDTPRSLLSSIKQELRSQSNEVIDMITDRLQTLARDLGEGTAASIETPPGGTVILNNFSSNPQPKYNGLSAGSDMTRWGLWANASGSYISNNSQANDFN